MYQLLNMSSEKKNTVRINVDQKQLFLWFVSNKYSNCYCVLVKVFHVNMFLNVLRCLYPGYIAYTARPFKKCNVYMYIQ